MRVWAKEKQEYTGDVWHSYGSFLITPRKVQMARRRGCRRTKPRRRWFVIEAGKGVCHASEANGYARLKDAKTAANGILDERNRAHNMRLSTACKGAV